VGFDGIAMTIRRTRRWGHDGVNDEMQAAADELGGIVAAGCRRHRSASGSVEEVVVVDRSWWGSSRKIFLRRPATEMEG
jgi:hypothetical protein